METINGPTFVEFATALAIVLFIVATIATIVVLTLED